MKIMTVMGTRPEIIRLSRLIPQLDQLAEHVLVHTGQNYEPELRDTFFAELGVRDPDHCLEARGGFGAQLAVIMPGIEELLRREKPDRLLVLGDTNSGLAALVAKRRGVPVFHMEAGNRCYDDRVPEEVNRRVIDHSSDVLMPYTERSRKNLLREGIEGERIFVTGNPIHEVIQAFRARIETAGAAAALGLEPGRYFLSTMHRAENVDREARLADLTEALFRLAGEHDMPVVVSTHPRTWDRMESSGLWRRDERVRFLRPFGFFDFVSLERGAFCVLTDSGTVQEECCILGVPNVTIRDVTERPETVECGSNMLAGADPDGVTACVRAVTGQPRSWRPPPEYLAPDVSATAVKILLGYRRP